jgi:CysZ protein
VINLLVPFILFFVSAYFMGFSLFDYNCERHRMTYRDSIHFMRSQRPYLLGVGAVYNILSYLPILGFIIPPVFAAVGATKTFLQIQKRNEQF